MKDLIGTTIKNHYRVEALIGEGRMSEVYRVYDLDRHDYLAMKVLKSDLAEDLIFIRRFKREAQTMAKLAHKNIERFYDIDREEDLVFLIVELIDGVDLRKIIAKHKQPFTKEMILAVMGPLCSALHFAHQSGVVHCDIKPANIMIDKDNRVVLADFGIARMTDTATATMVGFGAPAYMAPEQIKGEELRPMTDIYALGVMLFELATGGERPFTGERAKTGTNIDKVRWEQLHLAPPSPRKYNPNISAELEAVTLCCLEKDPKKRFGSVAKFYEALKRSLGYSGDKEVIYDWDIKGYIPPKEGNKDHKPIPVPINLLKILLIVAITGIFIYTLSQCRIPLTGPGKPNAAASQPGSDPSIAQTTINPTATYQGKIPPACTKNGLTWTSPIDGMVLHCVPEGDFIYGASTDSGR
jgi:serine/threonine protein kinase